MSILAKMQETQEQFELLQGHLNRLSGEMKAIEEQAAAEIASREKTSEEVRDALKRAQGAYQMLIQLGQEAGVVDENGTIIKEEAEVADPTATAANK